MPVIILLVFAWLVGRTVKRVFRSTPPAKQAVYKPANMASLDALQEQREILNDMLENIEFQLSQAPPEKIREKLLKDKARIFGQLAAVESKIYKLIT